MAPYNPYGEAFLALATRFKQHDNKTASRLSIQTSRRPSASDGLTSDANSRSTTSSSSKLTQQSTRSLSEQRQRSDERWSSRNPTQPPANRCPSCHLPIILGSAPPSPHLPHSPRDQCYGNFCPDISIPESPSSPPSRLRDKVRRRSLLCPQQLPHRGLDGVQRRHSRSPASSLGSDDGRNVLGLRHPSRCDCGSIIPQENLTIRYGAIEGSA